LVCCDDGSQKKFCSYKVFETIIMLPFVYCNITTTLAEIAEIAFELLTTKYPRKKHVEKRQQFGIVAKSTNNHCALAWGCLLLPSTKRRYQQ
jgi:hypothetical protein